MRTRVLPLSVAGLTAVFVCAAYAVAGYMAIRAMPVTLLVDLSLYPENIANQWAFVPFKKGLAQRALYSKTEAEIREDFRRYGYTLYSGVVGYREATLPRNAPRPAEDVKFLRDVASFVHRAGVGLEWVDGAGCTAIHQALIESDASSAKYLMELGAGDQVGANPAASYKPCRLDVASLAAEKGLSLK